MSLRKLPLSAASCCARAPTNVSNAPAIASATYSSQRHRSAFLRTSLPIDAVILYFLASRGREIASGCPNACRLPYCDLVHFASALIFSRFGPADSWPLLPLSRPPFAGKFPLLAES